VKQCGGASLMPSIYPSRVNYVDATAHTVLSPGDASPAITEPAVAYENSTATLHCNPATGRLNSGLVALTGWVADSVD